MEFKDAILIGVGVILSLVGFIANAHKKATEKNFDLMFTKFDNVQTKEMCEQKHKEIDKDINNIAEIAREK